MTQPARRAGAAVFAAALFALAAAPALASPGPEARARNATVLVATPDGRGAGIVVARDPLRLHVVTAAHVAECGVESVALAFRKEPVENVRVVLEDPALDLAVLQVPLGEPTLQAATRTNLDLDAIRPERGVSPGDRVHPIGHPLERRWFTPEPAPVVSTVAAGRILFGFPCEPGSSGGGVFDADWRVVGMMLAFDPTTCEALSLGAIRGRLAAADLPFDLEPPLPVTRSVRLELVDTRGEPQTLLATALGLRLGESLRTLRPARIVGVVTHRRVERSPRRTGWYAAALGLDVRILDTDLGPDLAPGGPLHTLYRTGSGGSRAQAWSGAVAGVAEELVRLLRLR